MSVEQTKLWKKQWKAAIINLGCKVNKYEADSMKDKLVAAGFETVEPEEKADVYIVNTCSVTNMAQKKSRQMLRRAKKMNPDAVIVAAGCYVNAEHDTLKAEEFVDVVVSNNCKKDIVTVIEEYIADHFASDYYVDINKTNEYEEMGCLAAENMDHRRAYIKIQDGCNQFCSYCIIPYTRGRVRSRSAEKILKEIGELARKGIKEFVLTGIHISSYGVDFLGANMQYDDVMQNGDVPDFKEESGRYGSDSSCKNEQQEETGIADLGQLIKAIAGIPEVERIRLGSLEPRIITEDFLQNLQMNPKFCPHFHLSLQSACDATLKRMNRKYTIGEFIAKCNMIREFFEKPAITTDVIVGFPGETEEEFSITLENLKKLNLYEIHVFKYSVRSGTVAEKLPNQVPEQIKNQRSDILLKLTAEQKADYENEMSGYVDEVLVEELLVDSDENNNMKEVVLEVHNEKTDGSSKETLEMNTLVSESSLKQLNTTEKAGLQENHTDESIQYYTGHTKRYVKVKIAATDNIINEVVKVCFI